MTDAERPDTGMRVLGFILLGCGVLAVGRAVSGFGDWRSAVLWAGMGVPLLLGGLLFNGWFADLCGALAWTLPATILFAGVVLLVDPDYASRLDGPKNQMDAGWQSYGLGVLFLLLGAAGVAGWAYAVRRALARRRA
ncbi:hypothetical protein [Spirillospora sp. NPDC048819]|uniref:hypothetical protein n=1 Tax=Spirillospora sp. NPDC048819 TaxID=3155268 RepID=UPI0033DD5E12